MSPFSRRPIGLVIAALALPPLLIFALRGLPRTDRPPASDFDESKPEGVCSYRACVEPSEGTFDVRVTTGTDSRLNRTIILTDTQRHRLCATHGRRARSGRWTMHGWRFWLSLGLMLAFSLLLSLGLIGLVAAAALRGAGPAEPPGHSGGTP